jgi:LuxR family transcriptional regulator, maltose regulon positive regulatory protein
LLSLIKELNRKRIERRIFNGYGVHYGRYHMNFKGSVDHGTTMVSRLPVITEALCKKAHEFDMKTENVHEIFCNYNMIPERAQVEIEKRPWPVSISTLGGFELSLYGAPVRFSEKIQRKSLLLLKALIAMGGKEVKEEHLADLLWPEADGYQAHRAFTTTISRLRRFFGHANFIEVHEGKVSLNPLYCRVDWWILEKIIDQAEARLKGTGEAVTGNSGINEEIMELAEKAVSIYKGPFLSSEGNQPWISPLRDRLKRKFFHLIIKVGTYFEAMNQWGLASNYYQNAMEMGELSDEELFQRLMTCHHRLGQPARAIEVYHHCRSTLFLNLGVKPSLKTEAIYRALIM